MSSKAGLPGSLALHSPEGRPHGAQSRRYSWNIIDPGLLLILALPFALFASGLNWVLDYVIGMVFIDPWIYWGYSLDLPGYLRAFPSTYYGSRLSWVLPGYLAHKLFSPVPAGYVLHLSLYYAAVIPLYLTLKHTVGRRAGLLSAILMGGYGYFLWAVGWDYVDGPGIAYFLLTMLALTNATRTRRSWLWLVIGGAMYGGMIYSQLFLAIFTPPLLLYYAVANQEQRHSLMRSSFFFASGWLAISVFLGWANYRLGGDFMFYAPSIRAAMELARAPNPYRLPLQMWWKQASWLIFPSWVFASSVAFVGARWKELFDRRHRLRILFAINFMICALIMLFFDLRGGSTLQMTYYASFLIPSGFLAVGAQLEPVTKRLSTLQFVLVICGVLAMLLFSYQIPSSSGLTGALNSEAPQLMLGLALFGAMLLFLRGISAKAITLSVACLTVALTNVASGSYRTHDSRTSKSGLLAIIDSVQAIRGLEPRGNVLFWYRIDEPAGNYYRSVASTYLWGYSLVNENFPSLDRDVTASQPPVPGRLLIVLTDQRNGFHTAAEALQRIDFGAQLLAERRIEDGPFSWNMLFIKLHYWPFLEEIRLDANQWPRSIDLRKKTQERQTVSLLGPGSRSLFQSDLDRNGEWQVNRYGRSGGLNIQPNCLSNGDSCGLYTSGDQRDHLATPFSELGADRASVFFSVWVKPIGGSAQPRIVLQNERFDTLAECEKLLDGQDGWALYGEWLDAPDARQIRVTVNQPRGSSSLLDKAMLVQVTGPSVARAAAGARSRAMNRLGP